VCSSDLKAAAWAKHVNVVLLVIELADKDEAIEFKALPKRIQMQLLDKFARLLDDKVAQAKKRASIVKAGRSRAEIDAMWIMNMAFWTDCALALTHHRYDSERESAAVKAKTITPKTESKLIAARIAKRKAVDPHAELVKEAVNAENRAKAQKLIDAKAKAKRKVKVTDLADLKKLDIQTEPETKATPTETLVEMQNDVI
jgi:hypothetical protein